MKLTELCAIIVGAIAIVACCSFFTTCYRANYQKCMDVVAAAAARGNTIVYSSCGGSNQ